MDICVEHHTYLGFSWRFNGVPRYFTFAVLPFGLGSACFLFHEIVATLSQAMEIDESWQFCLSWYVFGSQIDLCSAAAAAVIQNREFNSVSVQLNAHFFTVLTLSCAKFRKML